MNWFRNIGIMILLLLAGRVAAQVPVLDSVCAGAERYYRVDGDPGSTYSWILTPPAGPAIVMPSDADTLQMNWNYVPGNYELQAIQHSVDGCDADAVYGQVVVIEAPDVDAGPDDQVCAHSFYSMGDATASYTSSLSWETSGDGSFIDNTVLNAIYEIGPNDMLNGSVTLTLTGYGLLSGAGACDPDTSSMVLYLVLEIVPEFDPIGPLCQFSTPPPLPGISLEGITGTWEPPTVSTDVLGTFTYVFTPDDPSQCGVPTSMDIIITSEIIPEFTPIGPLCINSTPPDLPAVSLNGITGTWAPPVIDTSIPGIFTYDFSPDNPDQCGVETSMDITITTEILPLFDPIGPLCQFSPPPLLPGISLNGITGSWEPPVISTDVAGTFEFAFTPDPDQCGMDTTIEIIILPQVTPEFDPIGPVCQYTVGPPLPGISLNGITGTWDPPVIITAWPGTFTYTFTPDDPGQCGIATTMDITILPEITPEFDPIGPLCQFSPAPALPDTSLNGIPGTWDPPVVSTDAVGTFFYTFTPSGNIPCVLPVTIAITVVNDIVPEFEPIGPLCQNITPPALPDTSLNGISGTWVPATIDTSVPGSFTYVFTPDEGQCAVEFEMEIVITDEIIPVFDPIGPLCQNSTPPALPDTSLNGITGIWDPPAINTSVPGTFTFTFTPDPGQCGVVTTLDIEIVTEITPEFDLVDSLCQNSVPPDLPGISKNGLTGSWDPPSIDTSVPGTFSYTFTPDDPGQCGVETTLAIEIVTEISPNFYPIGPFCHNSFAPALPDTSLEGYTGTWYPPVINTGETGVFTFTFTPDAGQCAGPTTIDIEIIDEIIPLFNPIGPFVQDSIPPPLPGISLNGITGTWDPPVIDTSIPGLVNYTFTPDPGQCAVPLTITIEVGIAPILLEAITGPGNQCLGNTFVIPLIVDKFISVASFQLKLKYNVDKLLCEGYINIHPDLEDNLSGVIDPAAGDITINWQSMSAVTFSGIETVLDLVFTPKQPGQGELDWYTGATESYFINPDGFTIPAEFQSGVMTIYEPPSIYLEKYRNVCEGDSITLVGIAYSSQPPVSYQWTYPNGSTSTTDPTFASIVKANAGNYTLLATDMMGCTDQKTIYLAVSDNPVAAFHGTDTLAAPPGYILEAGTGLASYLWNTGETTESITIDSAGWYIVEMLTTYGCYGIDSIYIRMMEEITECLLIPNAFTPDNDGLNDTFKVISLCPISYFQMLIFNRWGEELFETNDINEGWDGTKHGLTIPGDSYVFKIVYQVEGVPWTDVKKLETGVVITVK